MPRGCTLVLMTAALVDLRSRALSLSLNFHRPPPMHKCTLLSLPVRHVCDCSRSGLTRVRALALDAQPVSVPDLGGLRAEAARLLSRALKKQSKAEAKAAACEAREAELLAQASPSLAELEALPACAKLRAAVVELAERSRLLQELNDGLQRTSSAPSSEFAQLALLAEQLGVSDTPPERPPPKPRRPKGPRPATQKRLPYRIFESTCGAEIRVGRTAADNDLLSTLPEYRDADDWWMHAAGVPGSHVVIRAITLPGGELSHSAELDAAVLAANYSRATLSGKVRVTLCRARQVSKPSGAKPGLVSLQGNVRTVVLDWRKERHRLDRLRPKPRGEGEANLPSAGATRTQEE
uniref:NFACT RNA-binding domain-containing protein n=1 Tax=Coccolithus braarudii TaxID=221442 RepID=A0A7S0L904_9EUKA|mmetsp:Transcript_24196/g.52167  ORF Transcript_24196/g.52167 Transcript_24196/m.52167 type:complete len:351 (+) Transcript_24196:56-1108(+)